MIYTRNGRDCPILIKGILNRKTILNFEIETLQQRIKRGLLNLTYLNKIMFHVTILVAECEVRNKDFLKILSIDQIYLNKNQEEDSNVFIFEEDQLITRKQKFTHQQLLFNLFQSLGYNLKSDIFKNQYYIQNIVDELFLDIFEQKRKDPQIKITERQMLIELYNIKIIKNLYNQAQSRVYLIETPYFINSQRNKIVVKWVNYPSEHEIQNYLYREIKLLEQVTDSDNCAKMFCYNNIYNQQFIFMKYYDATLEDLNNVIGKQELNMIDLIHLIKQMLLALKGLHSRNIIHRDLKPQNIMFEYINENVNIQEMRCVLIDFDRSDKVSRSYRSHADIQSDYQGTPDYQPPEGTQEEYDASYDIWQLGYIIQCILLRDKNKTYSRDRERPLKLEKYNNIFKNDNEKVQQKFPKFYSIINKMMDHNPKNRPNLQSIENEILKIN